MATNKDYLKSKKEPTVKGRIKVSTKKFYSSLITKDELTTSDLKKLTDMIVSDLKLTPVTSVTYYGKQKKSRGGIVHGNIQALTLSGTVFTTAIYIYINIPIK